MSNLFFRIIYLLIVMIIFTSIEKMTNAQIEPLGVQNNIRYNEKTKLPKAIYNVNSRQYSGTPAEVAREYLLENKILFKLKDNIDDLKVERIQKSPAGYHVGLKQNYNGIPVLGSETIVSINHENKISMVVNGYKPNIAVNIKSDITEIQAISLAKNAVKTLIDKELVHTNSELVIFQDSLQVFRLAWKIAIRSSDRQNEYLTLTDAHNGTTLKVWNTMIYCTTEVDKIAGMDQSKTFKEIIPWKNKDGNYSNFTEMTPEVLAPPITYINGTGKVFDPDPGTMLKDPNLLLYDYSDADYSTIQPAYDIVALNDLNNNLGNYKLQGRYAYSTNLAYVPPPFVKVYVTTTDPDSFVFNRSQYGFEEVSAYYFIDKMRRFIGDLGFNPSWAYLGSSSTAIAYDAMASNLKQGGYAPVQEFLLFGAPTYDFDVAEDLSAILHEYGHALHDALMYGGIELCDPTSDTQGISEGLSDYLAISYRRTTQMGTSNPAYPPYHPNHRNNWFYTTLSINQSIQSTAQARYPEPPNGTWDVDAHADKMPVWASTLMDIEYNIATDPSSGTNLGRDVTTKLLLASLDYVSWDNDVLDNVNAIFQADRDIYGGSHLSTLAAIFYNRGFFYYDQVTGPISSNTTWSGNKYVTGNVTVNSGVTLTISPNTFLFFNNGSSLTVNGTLTANGSSTDKITFDFITPNSTTQNGVKINTGATLNISNAIIKNAWYGIYCNNTYTSSISNWEIMNCNTGIYFSSTNLGISSNYIHNNSMGIALYNSSPTLTLNKITANTNYGVSSSGSTSIPKFGNGSTQGKNKITGNPVGVCAFSNSLPMLGNNSPVNGGYNTFGENTNYNVYALTSGVIYAINNYWGNILPAPPTSSKIWINNGVILYSPYLSSDPTGLSKAVATADDAVLALLSRAMNLIEQKDYLAAREICLDIVNNYSDSYAAFNALSILTQTFDLSEKETTKLNYKTLFNKDKKKLNAVAGLILAELDKENKLKNIDEVISKFKDDTILEDALFAKFLYYYNDIQDKANARLVSNELDKLFPNSVSSIDAHHHLGDQDYLQKTYSFLKTDQEQKQNIFSSPLPEEYNLFANYPNPFNPSTVIKYALPFASNVNVTVYNTLGQIVKEFYEGTKEAGYYSVNFTGENLSSGVYLYSLNAISIDGKQNFNTTKKMLLLK